MTDRKYRLFGLDLQSCIALTGLDEVDFAQPDVVVSFGDIDAALADLQDAPITEYKTWRASAKFFELTVPGIGRYLATGGNSVLIEPEVGADARDLSAFFMGSGMAAILQQRGFLTLHASAVETARGAALFVGRSGAGKSTLCYALQQRGFSMIADDMSALVAASDGSVTIMPSPPLNRLWGETLQQFPVDRPDRIAMRRRVDKFLVPSENHCTAPRPVERIFFLTPYNRPDIVLRDMDTTERVHRSGKFTFRRKVYRAQGLAEMHFRAITGLAKTIPMTQVFRPEGPFLLDELADAIVAEIG